MESSGLISRQQSGCEAAITHDDWRAVQAIMAARRRLLGKLLTDWPPEDREALAGSPGWLRNCRAWRRRSVSPWSNYCPSRIFRSVGGYDGVLILASDTAGGSPKDLKALIDTAHGLGSRCSWMSYIINSGLTRIIFATPKPDVT